MPLPNTKTSWAARADIVSLVAYVDAMMRIQPAITTLKLCNRLGRPNTAAVTRVPTELIQHIEDHLLAIAGAEAREETVTLRKAYRCFKNECEAYEHLSEKEGRELVKACQAHGITMPSFNYDRDVHASNQKVSRLLISDFANIRQICHPYDWRSRHGKECAFWGASGGAPMLSHAYLANPTLLKTAAPFLLDKYGLEVFASRTLSHWLHGKTFYDLTVHLVWPQDRRTVPAETTTTEPCVECGEIFCRKHQDVLVRRGVAISAVKPTDLSSKEHSRFTKALEQLGLMPTTIKLMVFSRDDAILLGGGGSAASPGGGRSSEDGSRGWMFDRQTAEDPTDWT